MNASVPLLWLVRHAGAAVALVAANNRDHASRLAHALSPDIPYCDFSTLRVGTSKQNFAGVVADLRSAHDRGKVDDTAPHVDTHPSRRRLGHHPGPRAPSVALHAFSALCAEFGIAEDVARSSHTPAATRLRWAIWSACLGAGYNQKQAADVTGHDHGTVSHTMVDIEAGKHAAKVRHPDTVRAYEFAVAAMRAETTGERPGTRCIVGGVTAC